MWAGVSGVCTVSVFLCTIYCVPGRRVSMRWKCKYRRQIFGEEKALNMSGGVVAVAPRRRVRGTGVDREKQKVMGERVKEKVLESRGPIGSNSWKKEARNTRTMTCYGKRVWKPGNVRFCWVEKAPEKNEERTPPWAAANTPPLFYIFLRLFYGQPYFSCTTAVINTTVEGVFTDNVCDGFVGATMGKKVVYNQMPQNKELGIGWCLLFTFLLHFYFKRWEREWKECKGRKEIIMN